MCTLRGTLILAASAAALLAASGAPLSARQEAAVPGQEVYDRWCAGCHGVDGSGNGPGANVMLPRPRNFQRAFYQVRTTSTGQLPTDADIMHVINEGMPGTTMPGWEDILTRSEREDLVSYLKSFSPFFAQGAPPPLEFGRAPGTSAERIASGREAYDLIECWQCHGPTGRGDGGSAPTLTDDADIPVPARDLTRNWLFNGGGTVEDIYRALRTGFDGTPMATFQDAVDAGLITDDQLWDIALYVRSLAPEDEPEVREVIGALLVEGALPSTPDDPAWEEAERYYVPMVGQIVQMPRWFNPRVTGLWVQALHDGQDLAMRVSWTDPSQSPDPEWIEYATGIREAMEPKEAGADWAPGAPDRIEVQFPLTLPTGLERPYFLGGDDRRPVYMWSWRSDQPDPAELVGTGLTETEAQAPAERQVQVASAWAEGEWSVVFRRSLATPDSAADFQFPLSAPVPVAFRAWDGDNGESGLQGSISTWYFVQLTQRTPVTVYATPALAIILTAGLGLMAVSRAQRRERTDGTTGDAG